MRNTGCSTNIKILQPAGVALPFLQCRCRSCPILALHPCRCASHQSHQTFKCSSNSLSASSPAGQILEQQGMRSCIVLLLLQGAAGCCCCCCGCVDEDDQGLAGGVGEGQGPAWKHTTSNASCVNTCQNHKVQGSKHKSACWVTHSDQVARTSHWHSDQPHVQVQAAPALPLLLLLPPLLLPLPLLPPLLLLLLPPLLLLLLCFTRTC